MKKIILILALLQCLCVANAQSSRAQSTKESVLDKNKFTLIDNSLFDCLYEYQVNTKDKAEQPVAETYNTILQVGNQVAKFWDYTAFASDSASYLVAGTPAARKQEFASSMLRQVYYFDAIIFQNYPADKLTVNDVITPNNYQYDEQMNDVSGWQLSSDTLTVCGHLCNKATGSYGGRDWVVWYTPEIPSSAGPWKLYGLPGLILSAQDSEAVHTFRAIAIRKNLLPIYIEKNAQRVGVTREKFIKNKIAFEKDPMKNIPTEAISNMSVVRFGDGPNDKTAYINGVQLRIRPNGYTALELR